MMSIFSDFRARHTVALGAAISLALTVPPAARAQSVETEMRRVNFHVDATLIMYIDYLRGRLLPTRKGQPPVFDDPASFEIEMDSATITLRTSALADLLNRYVFNYPGSPLRKLDVTTDGGRLKQTGHLHGLSFKMLSIASVTPAGELRLHPVWVHALLGISVKGLMHFFGLSLQKLANVRKAPGIRIEKDDLLLTPAEMLPPPHTLGKLVGLTIRDSAITLTFGGHGPIRRLDIPDPRVTNFMYFKGNTIRFGHLTMTPADLLVVDHDQRNPFDFWLAQYQGQLEAGVSHTTKTGGLITEWPDYSALR